MNQIQAVTQNQTATQNLNLDLPLHPLDDFVRVPGLLRRWEIEQVVTGGAEYLIEEAGEMADKTQVFAVYRRDPAPPKDAEMGVPVRLSFDSEQVTMRARVVPIGGEEPVLAVVVLGDHPEDIAALARLRDQVVRTGSQSRVAIADSAPMPSQEGASR